MRTLRVLLFMLLLMGLSIGASAQEELPDEQPDSVTIAGSFQSEVGCPETVGAEGDWAPDCDLTRLSLDPVTGIWSGQFFLPAGEYEYKVAINGSWDENYGGRADADGANVSLSVAEDGSVTFYYDHETNWVADDINHVIATVPGSFQSEVGCPESMGANGDWAPECLITWLQDPDADGIYVYVAEGIPAGDYEAKVAVGLSWDVNYGAGGEPDGANIAFSVAEDGSPVAFLFNTADDTLTINTDGSLDVSEMPTGGSETVIDAVPRPLTVEQPDMVVIPGTIQSVLGCDGDWQPDCDATSLVYSPDEDIWRGTFDIPAGTYEYKVAINGSWDENYGGQADAGGPNVALMLEEDTTVTFVYDHFTNWVADSVNDSIVTAPGDYQLEIGCPQDMGAGGDWAPECLRSWMQDPDGDGVYVFSTEAIPAGDYEMKVAVGQSWTENYGAGGAPGGPNIPFSVPEDGTQVTFVFSSFDSQIYIGVGEPVVLGQIVTVDLARTRAHWVAEDTIAWDVAVGDDISYALHYAADASLEATSDGLGGQSIPLTVDQAGLSVAVTDKFPHLAGLVALRISEDDLAMVPDILRGQMAVAAYDADGALINGTGLQIPGVLDDLYTYDGELGVTYSDGIPAIRVWAPTAQNVRLHLYADSAPETQSTVLDMARDDATGVWSITGDADWTYQYYQFEVQVYAPTVGGIVTNLVTDPYSVSLSMNSLRTQIVDIYNDETLMPPGWLETEKPTVDAPEDIAIYELHVRDFSVSDPAVPEDLQGTFAAFIVDNSNGMQHLTALAEAGLTHIHLLPSFDIATINENPTERVEPDAELLATFPSDSDQQAEIINATRNADSFNWGYDPFHFNVPEGSYSTNPDGAQRIIEFRQMVQALNQSGLRVVMDVVYNHTNASGQSDKSVLDRVVPGYYHRLTEDGFVQTSTCCQNTATEHNMMRKLMVDSIVLWTTAYRVDGYRFDLMGHHMLADMIEVREALDALTIETDGVDGESVYVYGEGWDFGEVAENARGINATQLNIPGTGIGVFNDRLRDAARGGSPFSGKQHQGFFTGLFTDPNEHTPGDETEQLARLLLFSDQIRVGLAGNLADYTFEGRDGEVVSGADVTYNGFPAGYTADPQENIVYVAAHDNETLWDAVQYKAPEGASIADRVRMNNLGISLVALSQGVPFFHAGDDMLRSKSLERDSYDAGDWFNRLDFTYQTNNWGVGLPPIGQEDWDIMAPLLGDESLVVESSDILSAVAHMREMLAIRSSSPLFRLRTAEDVQQRLAFHNTGPDQLPGVIVMSISDSGFEQTLDPNYEMVVVVFNSDDDAITFGAAEFAEMGFVLHPVQVESSDVVVQGASYSAVDGVFNVPGRTAAVFVLPR